METTNSEVRVKAVDPLDEKKRAKYYSKPDKVWFDTLRTWAGTKVFVKKKYSNGNIKTRLIKVLKRDDDVDAFIKAYKKEKGIK